jgi:hypothetical protein
MKKLISIALLGLFLQSSIPAEAQILKKLQKKVEREIDKTIDKSLEKTENGLEENKTDTISNEEQMIKY